MAYCYVKQNVAILNKFYFNSLKLRFDKENEANTQQHSPKDVLRTKFNLYNFHFEKSESTIMDKYETAFKDIARILACCSQLIEEKRSLFTRIEFKITCARYCRISPIGYFHELNK